jgi:hypothetical protein
MPHKHRRIGGYKLPTLGFTIEQLEVLQKGLVLFNKTLQKTKIQSPTLTLARQNYDTIMRKVASMRATGTIVTFDANELVIISTCLDMVLVDASFMANRHDFEVAVRMNERVKQSLSSKVKAPCRRL